MSNPLIPFNYRALVSAPNGSSTNGRAYRYFLGFEEAARCPGRIGVPEFCPAEGVRGHRPDWLQSNMEAQPGLVWC